MSVAYKSIAISFNKNAEFIAINVVIVRDDGDDRKLVIGTLVEVGTSDDRTRKFSVLEKTQTNYGGVGNVE